MTVSLKNKGSKDSRVKIGRFPKQKEASWYLIIADDSTDELFGLKRVHISKTARRDIQIELPYGRPLSQLSLKLFLMSDSYIGLD